MTFRPLKGDILKCWIYELSLANNRTDVKHAADGATGLKT